MFAKTMTLTENVVTHFYGLTFLIERSNFT